MKKIVFIHLPKTGGTSFRNSLCSAFGLENVSPPFGESVMSDQEAEYLERFQVISGHISILDVDKFFPDRDIITILRDPMDRVVSWYYFANSQTIMDQNIDVQAAQKFTADEFFTLNKYEIFRNIYNRQCRQLGGHALDYYIDMESAATQAQAVIDRCTWVGLQETLGEDMERLATIYPELGGTALPVDNVTPSRKRVNELGEKIRAAVWRLNEHDLALYYRVAHAKAKNRDPACKA